MKLKLNPLTNGIFVYFFIGFLFFLIRSFFTLFTREHMNQIGFLGYENHEGYWDSLVNTCFLIFFIIPIFYMACSVMYREYEEKDKSYLKNMFFFFLYYFVVNIFILAKFERHFLAERVQYFILICIFTAFFYNMILFFFVKKYRLFCKVFLVLLNSIILYQTIILGLINFFPSLFNLLYVNDFFRDEIFKLASPYKIFVIISTLFTIFFQLYLWWGHDKLISFLKNKKLKKESLKINYTKMKNKTIN